MGGRYRAEERHAKKGPRRGILGHPKGLGRGWEPRQSQPQPASWAVYVSAVISRGPLLGSCLCAQLLQGRRGSLRRSGDHRLDAERSGFKSWLCCSSSLASHFTCLDLGFLTCSMESLRSGRRYGPDVSPGHPAGGWQSQAGSPSVWPRALIVTFCFASHPLHPLPHPFQNVVF